MPEDKPLVPGGPDGSVASTATTPVPGSVTAPAVTATPAPADAEKLREYETRLAEAEAARQKIEQDLRTVKSSLQRRESTLTQDFGRKEREYQQMLEELRTASMDDDERKEYENQSRAHRLSELEEEVQRLRGDAEQAQAMTNAYIYFTKNGVKPEQLILDQGYDSLYQSGMEALTIELNRLRTAPPAASPAAPPKEPPTAPSVVTTTNPPAATKATWKELIATYGSEENVYSLVEQGRLPNSIIPT